MSFRVGSKLPLLLYADVRLHFDDSSQWRRYVVSPGGGGKLAIGGIGFSTVFQELGSWNPELVECIFTPSDADSDVVATYVTSHITSRILGWRNGVRIFD